jgi:hypothetical protein
MPEFASLADQAAIHGIAPGEVKAGGDDTIR